MTLLVKFYDHENGEIPLGQPKFHRPLLTYAEHVLMKAQPKSAKLA